MSYQGTQPSIAAATPAARIRSFLSHPATPTDGVLRALARLLAHRMDVGEHDLVADLCCGSGRFTRAFAGEARLRTPLVAVDARASLLAQLSSDAAEVRTALMEPLEFARFPAFDDCILMKDAFGEIRDPLELFRALRDRLEFGGRLAVVQSLGDAHADALIELLRSRGIEEVESGEVAAWMRKGGFAVTRSSAQLREAIPWATYLNRLGARYLPVLHYLKDAELRLGIDAIRSRHAPEARVEITDRFDIVLGICTGDRSSGGRSLLAEPAWAGWAHDGGLSGGPLPRS